VPGSRKDALAMLLSSRDDPDSPLTDEELIGAASIFLVAGVDTSSVTLSYIAYEIAKHPELFRILGDELTNYSDVDSLKSTELEQLPVLNAVIKETLRMWPPVAPLPRLVPPQGATLGGQHIPGDVQSLTSLIICRSFLFVRHGLYVMIRLSSQTQTCLSLRDGFICLERRK